MGEEKIGGTPLVVVAFVAFFILFLAGLSPFSFEYPMLGFDGSWLDASVYAALHRFDYGTQFVFTNGPMLPLYHREYAGPLTSFYLAARLTIVVFLALGFARLCGSSRWTAWIVVALAFVVLWPTITLQTNDALLLGVPLVTALLVLARRIGGPTLLVGVVLTAALSVAKISFIPFSLGAFLLVDIALLSRRRLPLGLIGYVAASWAWFVLAGQQWDAFLPFLRGSWEMTSAYGAAIGIEGPPIELVAWLALSALTLLILVATQIAAVRAQTETALIATLRCLLVLGFLFIALKAGFVRHDGHSVAAWGCLLLLLVLLALPAGQTGRGRTSWLYLSVPGAFMVAGLVFSAVTGSFRDELWTSSPNAAVAQLQKAARLAADPASWLAEVDREADAADAAIRAKMPLPPLLGGVDALSNDQQAIIAAGLDYAPRPSIHENLTASPSLIARNRAYLEAPDAPRHLLFSPGATDGRHPASVEGSLWPLLLSRYAVAGSAGDQLILDKRSASLTIETSAQMSSDIGFGADLPLPTAKIPLFLRLDIRQTMAGKLADLAFKAPRVDLVLSYTDGTIETYRLIPGMIHEGMLVAPTVKSVDDYVAVAHGSDLPALRFPVSLRVETTGPWAYEPVIHASLERLAIPPN